ncbi:hypothetical protein [uncultured Chryseobacterium sp.]|uniref:hypothetical protein n=1 Tax=uncultured Chryseobacterium sp. TaxID=259322 RepID=UPI0025EE5FE7|nr:hypothetical protein [uncultured Chryseobacterium sp.]
MKASAETSDYHPNEKIINKILSKSFAPFESVVTGIQFSDFRDDSALLMIKNDRGESAEFSWQQNVVSSHIEKGYFKEVMNDLGVTVHHNEDSITVINGGAQQFLTAELKG